MWNYTVQNDQGGHPRWWLWNSSGTMMALSGESFDSTSNATRAALNFKEHAAVWNYVTFTGNDGNWYWHARASNGKNVAASGRSYATQADARASANAVRVNGGAASGP